MKALARGTKDLGEEKGEKLLPPLPLLAVPRDPSFSPPTGPHPAPARGARAALKTLLPLFLLLLSALPSAQPGKPDAPSSPPPLLLWSIPAGAGDTAPLLAGPEGVYAAGKNRNLSSFDWQGRKRWTYEAPSPLWPHSLALSDRVLLAGARGGWVVAIEAGSGREIWRRKVEGELVWAPLAEGGSFFLATTFAGPGLNGRGKGRVYRLRAGDGEVLWARETDSFGLTTPARGRGVLVVGGGSYGGENEPDPGPRSGEEEGGHSFLAALDPESGEIIWQRTFRNGFIRYLEAEGEWGFYLGYEDRVCAFSLLDGSTRWCRDPGNWVTGMKIYSSTLYLGSANGFLLALEARSGREIWRYDLPGVFNYPLGPPVAEEGKLAFNTTGGEMYVLDASHGRLRGRWPVPRSRAHLAAWGSKAVLPSPEGEIQAYLLSRPSEAVGRGDENER